MITHGGANCRPASSGEAERRFAGARLLGDSHLRTGPTGLRSVLIAIAAATRKPITVPSVVAFAAGAGIHRRRPPSQAAAQLPSSPPERPPTKSQRCPSAAPAAEPTRAQNPTVATRNTKSLACFMDCEPNAKLTDDEERATDARHATCGWPRSSSFGPASCSAQVVCCGSRTGYSFRMWSH